MRIEARHWLGALAAAALVHGLALYWLAVAAPAPTGSRGGSAGIRLLLEAGASHLAGAPQRAAAEAPPGNEAPAPPPAPELASAPDLPPVASAPARAATPPPGLTEPAQAADAAAPRAPAGSAPLAERAAEGSTTALAAAAPDAGELGARGAETPGEAAGSQAYAADADDYFAALSARVTELLRRRYPKRARRDGVEGMVVLDMRIDREGHIEHCRVGESSGSAILDRHAVQIVERAGPFGPVPRTLPDVRLEFEFPLEYRLTEY